MRLRNTFLTGAASYVQMGSLVLTQLIAIPLAFRFLDDERFGLWSFTSQSLGYLLLLDFGVSGSLGRLLADPLHQGDTRAWNGWLSLVLAVMLVQAALILGGGLLLVNPILRWFEIPAPLVPEARQLWLFMVGLNAVTFPLRLFQGILTAQNRSYWVFVGVTAGAWAGLLAFYLFLKHGWGTMAFGMSAAGQMLLGAGLPAVAAVCGPIALRFSIRNIPWHHARELFGFSSAVFVVGIATQAFFMSQALVIQKILGLGAVASFSVCSKVPLLLMQFIWRPFDAFTPRWQIYWARGDTGPMTSEFSRTLRFTMGLAAAVMLASLALNRWFVIIFGKEELYAGKAFDFFFALFVIAQVWCHCMAWCFLMAKRVKGYAAIVALDTALGITAAILGTKGFGLSGYVGALALYGLAGVGLWYMTLRAPPVLQLSPRRLARETLLNLWMFLLLLGLAFPLLHHLALRKSSVLPAAEAGVAVLALGLFGGLFRPELLGLIRRLRSAQARPAGD